MPDADTERTSVRTYVPAYQKDRWREHADRLGMSQSEFVRTMVQAGRRDFEIPERPTDGGDGDAPEPETDALAERVREALAADGPCSWDELLASVTDDVEERLEATLSDLQDANVVRYSGRDGGYTLREES